MKKGLYLSAILAGIAALLILAVGRLSTVLSPVMGSTPTQQAPLVLDAGHGGEDGGAVSLSGIPESQINLDITIRLRDILVLYGTEPVMIRETDQSLHDPSAVTLREKKRSDLHNRVSMVNEQKGATLISIHQNTYQNYRYHGAQVFYAPTAGSQELAEYVQSTLHNCLQPENQRTAKMIPNSVYLMNHINCPAILVECGFLTNPEEERLLKTPAYQKKLAAVLAAAWLTGDNIYNP